MIAQLTLRNVPDEVKKRLRARAEKAGHSINRTTLELLEQALGIRPTEVRKRNLARFAGQWSPEESRTFEKNVRIFEKIDADVWPK